jgi:hypothetical protein
LINAGVRSFDVIKNYRIKAVNQLEKPFNNVRELEPTPQI